MISGETLRDTLSIQRSYVQQEIVRTTRKMLDSDLRLNLLRLDEVIAWRAYSKIDPDEQVSIERIRELLTKHYDKAHNALDVASTSDEAIAGMRETKADVSSRVRHAKAEFDMGDHDVRQRLRTDIRIKSRLSACKTVAAHISKIHEWVKTSKESRDQVVGDFRADRMLGYLHTKIERQRKLTVLDRAIARWKKFDAQKAVYEAAKAYPLQAQAWLDECEKKFESLKSEINEFERDALAALEPLRDAMIRAMNDLNEVDTMIEHKVIEGRDAMQTVVNMVLGRDKDYSAIVETFVEVLAQERASAVIELAKNPARQTNRQSANIDQIVSKRHSLSIESDAMRRQAKVALARLKLLEDLIAKMELRHWHSADTRFELSSNDRIFGDIANGTTSFEVAWEYLSSKRSEQIDRRPKASIDLDFELAVTP